LSEIDRFRSRLEVGVAVPSDAQATIDALHAKVDELRQELAACRAAEEALRDDEARYRLLAEATLDGILVHDFKTIVAVNNRLPEVFGYAPDELIGQPVEKLTDLVALEDLARIAERALAGDPVLIEMTGIRRDGTRFPIQYAARDFTLRGRRVRVGVGRDISERKRAEAALAERDERLRLAIAAGRMIAWERIPGEPTVTVYSATHSLAEPHQDLEKLRAGLHPEDAARVHASFEAALTGDGRYQAEYRVRGADGGWRWMDDRGTVHYDDAGKPVRVIGIARDITQRKAAEEALRDSEERLRAILETLPHIAFLMDNAGTMLFFNRQYVDYFGKAVIDLERRRELFHPDDWPAVRAVREAGVVGASEYAFEARVRRHDGAWRWHAVRIRPLRQKGKPLTWLGMSVDVDNVRRQTELLEQRVAERTAELEAANRELRQQIADRERAETALGRAQRMEAVGQLTGGVAHDFNNLLTAVIGSLEIIRRDALNPRVMRLADSALNAASRGAELTQQLLSFSRRQVLNPVVANVGALLAEMEILLRHAGGGVVDVAIDNAADLWPCELDTAQFQSAILNLLVNARDAMPEGGRLLIESRNVEVDALPPGVELAAGAYVAVAVRDAGQGMTPEVVAHAFEPFYTTKDIGKGSGLGLSMVYGFAKQSGGGVNLESAPGAGTCVTLYLPRASQREVSAPDHPAAEHGTGAILVVDDDEQVRTVSIEMLLGLGYRVSAVCDGHEALALLRQQEFDLLFSDVVMPKGMSGLEVARQAQRLHPRLKVLLASGYPLADGDRDGFRLLAKPYRLGDLAAAVAELVARPGSDAFAAASGMLK
jgi:PAS domain S-box-containing protein